MKNRIFTREEMRLLLNIVSDYTYNKSFENNKIVLGLLRKIKTLHDKEFFSDKDRLRE